LLSALLRQAWTWERGQRRNIIDANGTFAGFAYDINDAGQGAADGFIYDGTLTRIPTPPGYAWTRANVINQQGDAVGWRDGDPERGRRAFTWFDGVMTVLDIPPRVGAAQCRGHQQPRPDRRPGPLQRRRPGLHRDADRRLIAPPQAA